VSTRRAGTSSKRDSQATGRVLALRFVRSLGFSVHDFEIAEQALRQGPDDDVLPSAVFWRVMQKSYEDARALDHWHTLTLIDAHRALLIKGEGGDFRAAREASSSHEIQEIMALGSVFSSRSVSAVKVVSGGCCPPCDALDDRCYSFSQALNELPIPRVCTASWCTCTWVAQDGD